MDWFRAHHGISNDIKLTLISTRLNVPRCEVGWIWMILLDAASQNSEDRGNIGSLNAEEIAMLAGVTALRVTDILGAFRERGMLTREGRLVSWDKRQPDSDPTHSERQRRYRQRLKASVTSDERDASRDTEQNRTDRTEQNRTEQTQKPARAPISIATQWKSDEQYARFAADYLGTGAALIDADFAEAYAISWRLLSFEQKLERIAALNKHSEEYHADPRFVPKPLKFLETEWQRPPKPKARDSPSLARKTRQQEQADGWANA